SGPLPDLPRAVGGLSLLSQDVFEKDGVHATTVARATPVVSAARRQVAATALHAGTPWKDFFQPSLSGSALRSVTALEMDAFICATEARTCADALVMSL